MVTTLHSITPLNESSEKCPVQLLVSVRDLCEAAIAIEAKVDWLDVKDPQKGPLGRPELQTALAIERLVADEDSGMKISVALGESRDADFTKLLEYTQHFETGTRFKLAFSGAKPKSQDEVQDRDNSGAWSRLFRELASRLSPGCLIPVFYADREFAMGPTWEEIVNLAVDVGGNRILIDTFQKDGRSLLHHLTAEQLASMIPFASDRKLAVALAGSLRVPEISSLFEIGADIIGVRGAACKASNRADSIDPASLQELVAIFKSHQVGAMDPQFNLRKP